MITCIDLNLGWPEFHRTLEVCAEALIDPILLQEGLLGDDREDTIALFDAAEAAITLREKRPIVARDRYLKSLAKGRAIEVNGGRPAWFPNRHARRNPRRPDEEDEGYEEALAKYENARAARGEFTRDIAAWAAESRKARVKANKVRRGKEVSGG